MARLKGREGRKSPEDMKPSSSASQSDRTEEQRGDVSRGEVWRCNDGGLRCLGCLDLRIALRRYFMDTLTIDGEALFFFFFSLAKLSIIVIPKTFCRRFKQNES